MKTAVLLMFIFVSANHMGLISKIESILGYSLPIVNCPKCITFWLTLVSMLATTKDVIISTAVAFAFAYLALWLELAMGVLDHYYMIVYEKIVSTAAPTETTSGAAGSDTSGTVSHVRKK